MKKTPPNTKKAEQKTQQEAQADEPVEWPRIRLNGVMATRKRTEGIAIIDGQITSCGQQVKGVKLISVHKDGVVLEFEGDIRTLRVGGEMF
jgi:type II secretory pathway component PulC